MQYHFFLNSDASKYYTEGVFSVNPLKDFIIRAKEIRNAVPNKYDSSNAMKKFVDKYYDDIIRINKILELEKDDRVVFEAVTSLGWIVAFIGGAALMSSSSVFLASAGMWLSIISTIILFVNLIISNVRRGYGEDLLKLLKQIRDGLSQINLKSLPREYKIKIVSLIKELDDTIMNIGNGFDPPPPPDVHFVYSLNSGSDYDMDNETYTEGFTKDVSKTYRDSFNLANNKIKEAKKFMKSGEYIEARVSIKQARDAVTTAQKQINEMSKNTNLPDNIIGMIYGNMISLIKALVFALPTLGFSFGVAATKNLYTRANAYYTKIKNKEDMDSSVFNTYLNHVNHVLNEVIRTLNKLEAEIAKKENSLSSSSDTTSKPNKKKIFNKKDKNINESTSVKVLLASDLLSDMEDLF